MKTKHVFPLVSLALALFVALSAAPVWAAKKKGSDKPSEETSEEKLIDLRTADPTKVDLSKIDPAKLLLTKESVKRIDLDKWDLSKIDTSKVKDPLAAKWIIKVLRQEKEMDKTLGKYKPGELEKIQQQNLEWLRKPAPFREAEPTRNHRHTPEQIERAAKMIDEAILAKLRESNQDFNPLTSDEQFVRRLYLDIAGRIPTAQEVQAFLGDHKATKRRDLIDKLLLSEDYPSQMFNWLADMLRVKELKSNQGENTSYQAWLMDQVTANHPWNQTVRDMLTAEGDLVTNPAVGWLVRDSGMPLDSLSNTLTTFMGANVACAQCHDHPFNDYTQRNFYELAAFFGSTRVPGSNVRGAPKILKDRYHSVTTEPKRFLSFPDDYKYKDAKPGTKVTPAFAMLKNLAPRSSGTTSKPLGREDFAAWMTSKKNEQFAATIANRLWGKAFGRAIMEPVTEMDELDKADNPKLIHLVSSFMQFLDFDLLAFQRVIYNTRAYQSRASVSPEVGDSFRFPGPCVRRMTAEQAWDSMATLIDGADVNDIRRDRRSLMWSYDVFKDGAIDAIEDAGKGRKIEFDLLLSKAEKMSSELRSEIGEGGKRKKSKKSESSDSGSTLARASEREQPESNHHFLRQFGQSERELADAGSTEGSVPQTLMLMNGETHELLSSPKAYVIKLAKGAHSETEQTDLVYLSFLGRHPTSSERTMIARERIELNELIWLLMNSREFIFVQ